MVLAFSLIAPLCALAQQQEKTLMDRIQRPDMQLGSPLQSKSYEGTSDLKIKSAAASSKTYGVAGSANLKEFQGSRSFLGIKNPWFGERTYDAKTASLTTRGGGDLTKSYRVKQAAVSPYSASTRSANPSKPEVPLKPFLVQGEAQGAMQQISDKVKKEMTIDDVRELLNKPR
jgi:hypothetical protein